ncbi:MAG: hypothetical protein ACHP7P_13470 [Terriglobales bacterium]
MLKDLIAQAFCREIRRKLRRFGVLGLILSSVFALYVELPLEISVATKEAQVMMINVEHSVKESVTQWERREVKTHFGREVQSTYNRKD